MVSFIECNRHANDHHKFVRIKQTTNNLLSVQDVFKTIMRKVIFAILLVILMGVPIYASQPMIRELQESDSSPAPTVANNGTQPTIAPTTEGTPAQTSQETAAPTSEETPAGTSQESPAPTIETTPAATSQGTAALTIETPETTDGPTSSSTSGSIVCGSVMTILTIVTMLF